MSPRSKGTSADAGGSAEAFGQEGWLTKDALGFFVELLTLPVTVFTGAHLLASGRHA